VTVGGCIGQDDCPIPTCGLDWTPTLPPVVLDRWPAAKHPPRHPFTTVANWRGYGSVVADGVHYGQKAHSLRELLGIPERATAEVALALSIHPDERPDLEALTGHGWRLLDPVAEAGTPAAYRDFVRDSTGELGIAKSGYVRSRSGWFSDRSACYLASGRPVVAQDTGFDAILPTGEGLLTFEGVDDAAVAFEEVCGDYPRHQRAARAIAETHLDANVVLRRFLDAVLG
jgi:hypothetical protein